VWSMHIQSNPRCENDVLSAAGPWSEHEPSRPAGPKTGRSAARLASVLMCAAMLSAPSVVWAPSWVWAQAALPATPSPPIQVQSGFADLANRLAPAVVGISAKRALNMPKDAIHGQFSGPGGGFGAASTGSGFIIAATGIVVTNNHVIEGADSFEISLSDGTILPAVLVGRDSETDLAVLRARSPRALPFVRWGDSDQARVGDWAIAIGSPFGLGNSLSVGVISGRNRDLQAGRFDDFLQTDAAINRGNSGGPLFNARGEVVGVNTAIVSPGGNGGGSVGVGFAVPSNQARKIVTDILATGSVQRGWIGLRARMINLSERTSTAAMGVIVTEVAPNSPAARAGLRPGDRINTWAGKPVTDPRALARFVAAGAAGSAVRLEGQRGRQRIFANLTIGKPPSESRPPSGTGGPPASALGLVLRGAVATDQPLVPATVRVIIAGVDPFGPGRDAIRPGDGLMEVQGKPVASAGEARALLQEAARKRDAVVVRIWRNGQSVYRALRPTRR
jgi:serine protease Do